MTRLFHPFIKVEIKDLSKYGSTAVAKGDGMRFEETTSPVDPGETGKVAEAVDVCFSQQVKKCSRLHLGFLFM